MVNSRYARRWNAASPGDSPEARRAALSRRCRCAQHSNERGPVVRGVTFTGTQRGMTDRQTERVRRLLRELAPTYVVHGERAPDYKAAPCCPEETSKPERSVRWCGTSGTPGTRLRGE
jgi:hypothetical protein